MENQPSQIKILTKLSAIMGEVGYIQKDKKNNFHNYSYLSEQAIKETLHPLFVKNKVLILPSASEVTRETITTDKGRVTRITDIKLIYTFYDAESGESISGNFLGTGEDGMDKGTYKAITGAIKYILTTTFLIPTGDDPEETTGQEKANFAPQSVKPVQQTPKPTTKASPSPVSSHTEPSKEVTEVQKKRIKELADRLDTTLDFVANDSKKEAYETFVFDKTGFKLTPVNYKMIISTLTRYVNAESKKVEHEAEKLVEQFEPNEKFGDDGKLLNSVH